MKKSLVYSLLAMVLVIVSAPFVLAAPEAAAAAPAGTVDYTKAIIIGCSLLAAGHGDCFWNNRNWKWYGCRFKWCNKRCW